MFASDPVEWSRRLWSPKKREGHPSPREACRYHVLPPPTQGDRFQTHSKLGNRRLLWHGTNVAVVAAILTSGLRIMPHSGGRVGKGIYFASENSKSASYGEPPHAPPPGWRPGWAWRLQDQLSLKDEICESLTDQSTQPAQRGAPGLGGAPARWRCVILRRQIGKEQTDSEK